LISFGLAGGLSPELRPGDVVVPAAVLENGVRFGCDPALTAALGGGAGVMLAAEAIIGRAADKAALFAASQAAAVDLESGAVARVAAAAGLPFAVLRAVADSAAQNLPPAAMIGLTADGRIDFAAIAASLLRLPGQVPGLIAVGRNAKQARAALVKQVGFMTRGGA
jgi:adenosylhomocysteine nucleosidase